MIPLHPQHSASHFSLPRAALLCAALTVILLAAACSPAPTAATQPPAGQPEEAYPADPQEPAAEAYPVMEPTAAPPEAGYPAGPGPLGVQVVDNRSQITGRLVESVPDPERPEFTRLKLEVLTSDPVEGFVNYAAGAVGQQIDVYAPAQDLPAVAPGDTLSAEVRFEGDERGGAYYAGSVAVVTQ